MKKQLHEIRDDFAAAAIQGLICVPDWELDPNKAAEKAYEIADAMMKARKKSIQKENKNILKHVFEDMASNFNKVYDEEGCTKCDLFNQIKPGGGCKYVLEGSCKNRNNEIFRKRL